MSETPPKVAVLFTGGTIGMQRGPRGYVPVPGYLGERMGSMATFHLPGAPRLTLPPSDLGGAIHYTIFESERLVDSSNMTRVDWVALAHRIAELHEEYAGFVVVHGTDTMAYTASALSFMLEGLQKPVVVTGSQIPLSRVRNDAVDNLLGALLIAGHFEIPEVVLYFNHKLLRGNRSQKVDAQGLNAFRSGNLPPLAELGLQVEIRWDLVLPPTAPALRVRPITDQHVVALRLFPGITTPMVEQVLGPPLRGAILETYGAGNAPDAQTDLLRVLREASDRGVVLVNTTQCHRGMVRPDYAAGQALAEAGVVPGADMTPEAALTKLQWLLSEPREPEEVRALVTRSLRGELTELSGVVRRSWRA
ncbi:MAG: L-asparaginase 1 [Deltaproteobacteria bacterium]|nr:MAG: L-asparaginase 1 [Deltaproteobacteria bacterium]